MPSAGVLLGLDAAFLGVSGGINPLAGSASKIPKLAPNSERPVAGAAIRYDHFECTRANSVMKRRIHYAYFAISGYIDTRSRRLYPYFLHLDGIEILIGRAANKRA